MNKRSKFKINLSYFRLYYRTVNSGNMFLLRKYLLIVFLVNVNGNKPFLKPNSCEMHQHKTDHLPPDSRQRQTPPDPTTGAPITTSALLATTVITIRYYFQFFHIAPTAHSYSLAWQVLTVVFGAYKRTFVSGINGELQLALSWITLTALSYEHICTSSTQRSTSLCDILVLIQHNLGTTCVISSPCNFIQIFVLSKFTTKNVPSLKSKLYTAEWNKVQSDSKVVQFQIPIRGREQSGNNKPRHYDSISRLSLLQIRIKKHREETVI
jgi:hypothetical protein